MVILPGSSKFYFNEHIPLTNINGFLHVVGIIFQREGQSKDIGRSETGLGLIIHGWMDLKIMKCLFSRVLISQYFESILKKFRSWERGIEEDINVEMISVHLKTFAKIRWYCIRRMEVTQYMFEFTILHLLEIRLFYKII